MIVYRKLVRDLIPEHIKDKGKMPEIGNLSKEAFKFELLRKLAEEAHEVIDARNNKEKLTEEVADMLEVIKAIAVEHNLDKKEILRQMNIKREKKGGFQKGIFLKSVK